MYIKVFTSIASKEEIVALAKASYGDMLKGVVDVHRRIVALGGELNSDAEQIF